MTGDLNVELGISRSSVRCADLLCWLGYDHDPGGFKKLMWCGIMKEFKCKAAWSKCGRANETAFTHRQLGDRKSRMEIAVGLHHWAQKEGR